MATKKAGRKKAAGKRAREAPEERQAFLVPSKLGFATAKPLTKAEVEEILADFDPGKLVAYRVPSSTIAGQLLPKGALKTTRSAKATSVVVVLCGNTVRPNG